MGVAVSAERFDSLVRSIDGRIVVARVLPVVAPYYGRLLSRSMTSGLIVPVEVLELIADYSLRIGLGFVLNLSATSRHFAAYLRKPAVARQVVQTIQVSSPTLAESAQLICQALLLPVSVIRQLPAATSDTLSDWLGFLRRQLALQSIFSRQVFNGQRRSQSLVDLHIPRPPTCNSEGEWIPTPTYGLLSRITEVRLRPISVDDSGRFEATEYSRIERLEWLEHEGTANEVVKRSQHRLCRTPAGALYLPLKLGEPLNESFSDVRWIVVNCDVRFDRSICSATHSAASKVVEQDFRSPQMESFGGKILCGSRGNDDYLYMVDPAEASLSGYFVIVYLSQDLTQQSDLILFKRDGKLILSMGRTLEAAVSAECLALLKSRMLKRRPEELLELPENIRFVGLE
ncbi:hypothetical protein FOZ62_015165 [Perkinsus olseni]|uniref:Uncharacterized protein n=1 Tax=Perkinsus olseni TaxID=32597 RepID=A0A7J6SJ24_PEROL|nr:hypothetical protein FOZ62_015165 [Perkinsus olseni]